MPCHAKSKHVNLNSKRIGIDGSHVALQLATCGVEKFSVVVELLRLKVCRERKKKCVDVAVACPLRYFKDQT